MDGGACFDGSGAYRYRLWRAWERTLPAVTFVMLNPSAAGAETDDPTIRRCIGFARSWGFGGIEVVNLCGFRASSPRALFVASDPEGAENQSYLQSALEQAGFVVAAWGNLGRRLAKPPMGAKAYHLGLTRLGEPRHPLYVRAETTPSPWSAHQPRAGTR
ncbi:MAG: DUF1643 domain-containing protein [Tepidiformaceae bacterium]